VSGYETVMFASKALKRVREGAPELLKRVWWLVAPTLALVACTNVGDTLVKNADRELGDAGLSEAHVPIGRLFDLDEGAVCIVSGQPDALGFSVSVPNSLHASIASEVSHGLNVYDDNNIYVFDRRGRLRASWSVHWRSETFYMSTPDDQNIDACLGAEDIVLVERGSAARFSLIYSLPNGAGGR
jgi:hypothetical protein